MWYFLEEIASGASQRSKCVVSVSLKYNTSIGLSCVLLRSVANEEDRCAESRDRPKL